MFDYPEKRALIVDDDEYYQESIGSVLRSEKIACSRLYTGENALLFLETISFRLLIIEEHLPGLGGLEVAAVARGLQPSAPIIITTTSATPQGAREAALLGAFEYVVKPFDSTWIRSRISQALIKSFVPSRAPKAAGGTRSTMPETPSIKYVKNDDVRIIIVESDDRVRGKIIAAASSLGCSVSAFKTMDRAIAQSKMVGFDVLIARPDVISADALWSAQQQETTPSSAVAIIDEMHANQGIEKALAKAKGTISANADASQVSAKLRLIMSQLVI